VVGGGWWVVGGGWWVVGGGWWVVGGGWWVVGGGWWVVGGGWWVVLNNIDEQWRQWRMLLDSLAAAAATAAGPLRPKAHTHVRTHPPFTHSPCSRRCSFSALRAAEALARPADWNANARGLEPAWCFACLPPCLPPAAPLPPAPAAPTAAAAPAAAVSALVPPAPSSRRLASLPRFLSALRPALRFWCALPAIVFS
jgi:hypothetical protein